MLDFSYYPVVAAIENIERKTRSTRGIRFSTGVRPGAIEQNRMENGGLMSSEHRFAVYHEGGELFLNLEAASLVTEMGLPQIGATGARRVPAAIRDRGDARQAARGCD